MLNEEQLEYLPEQITRRLEAVNQHFLEMVGARIKEIGSMSATDIHRLEQMKAVGADVEKITTELTAISGKNAAQIKEIFDIVSNDDVQFSEQFLGSQYIPYTENTALKQYVAALAAQSIADYANMSQNTAFMTYQGSKKVLTSLSQAYTNIIDEAIVAVTSGQTDFYSAMRGSLKQFADSGIRTKYSPLKGSAGKAVDYASGYSRRLDTAIRQNLLWGIKQCNQGVQEQVGESFGSDGWEIDYHPHPRPSHSAMSGRQYAAGDKGKVIDGVYYPPFTEIEDLLDDYGCLHRKWPILLGISEPNHSPEELARLKADDEKKIEFEGEEYTKYELSQIQRKLETAARHAKDRQIIAKAAGDDELRRQEQAKINLITSKYAKLSKAAGLPTRAERMSVSKYRKVKTFNELQKTAGSNILRKSIDLDELQIIAKSDNIKPEIVDTIFSTVDKREGRNSFFISQVTAESIAPQNGKAVLMQTEPFILGRSTGLRLVLNTDEISDQTLKQLNERIKKSNTTTAQNFEEAVIHETGHAKLIFKKSIAEIQSLYDELADKGIDGISKIARDDGAEAIAEIEVLLNRGDTISDEAKALYNKYIGGLK